MDAECGHKHKKCPRYCNNDGNFIDLYEKEHCKQIQFRMCSRLV
jgi:hypothetical protein